MAAQTVTRLRIERVIRGLTILELAVASGVSTSRISFLERAMVQPAEHEAEALARVLRISADQLFQVQRPKAEAGAR
jgi:transcriptional regulator with XRE-family HTH domain